MEPFAIHMLFLPTVREAARNGASAKDLVVYFEKALAGMRINAAFAMDGASLLDALTWDDAEPRI